MQYIFLYSSFPYEYKIKEIDFSCWKTKVKQQVPFASQLYYSLSACHFDLKQIELNVKNCMVEPRSICVIKVLQEFVYICVYDIEIIFMQ